MFCKSVIIRPKKHTCPHYSRGFSVKTPCCNEIYPCRQCHNEKAHHDVDRKDIKEFICIKCKKSQECQLKCIQCRNPFGNYICHVCHLICFTKELIFHCDKCGICRQGNREHYTHCDTCQSCINKKIPHTCRENSLKDICPVCHDSLFDSPGRHIQMLDCSHHLHVDCYLNSLKNNIYFCNICKKSMVNMTKVWKRFDNISRSTIICTPNQKIICNDCNKSSVINYKIDLPNRCTHCPSYNTTR